MTFLLDSNICIAAMKGEKAATDGLDQLSDGQIALPTVVVAELIYGAYKSSNVTRSLDVFLAFSRELPQVPFDSVAAGHYGRIKAQLYRIGTPIGPNDFLIAATALAHDATLVSRNVREFSRIPGLRRITF